MTLHPGEHLFLRRTGLPDASDPEAQDLGMARLFGPHLLRSRPDF